MDKRKLFWGSAALALLVPAAVAAQVTFTDGETLVFQKLNTLAATAPPIGSIVAYVGALNQLPSGWLPCDGSAVPTSSPLRTLFTTTPDMRGMFLRGTGGSGPPVRGTQVDATAVNGLSFNHRHASRVVDNLAGACNAGNSFNGQTSLRTAGPQVLWSNNATNQAGGGCMYDTGTPIDPNHNFTGPAAAASVQSTDTETRPANVGVTWIIRVN